MIAPGQVVWVDIDFKGSTKAEAEVLRSLRTLSYPPSLIVHSGNGFHAYWLLGRKYPSTDIEVVNQGIGKELRAALVTVDSTHNADRFLRIPGSQNLKDPQQPKPCRILDRV